MAWQSYMTVVVRGLINDLTEPYTYTDERIQQSIVIAGIVSSMQYVFDYDYTFDPETPDISPDPVESSDTTAIALMSLKAACILDTNKYQGAVANGLGVRVQDGDSQVDTSESVRGYSDIMKLGPCNAFNTILRSASISKSGRSGKVVATPMTHPALYPYASYASDFFNNYLGRDCRSGL